MADVLGYTVLIFNGRRLAVPPGALQWGPGSVEFTIAVQAVIDLVESREVVGRIDDVLVRLALPPDGHAPEPGERLLVHATRSCEVA